MIVLERGLQPCSIELEFLFLSSLPWNPLFVLALLCDLSSCSEAFKHYLSLLAAMSAFPPSAATDPNLPHDSLVPQVIGICSAMLVLVTLVIVARFWVRWTLVKARLGPDDWCILVSWVLAVAFDLDPINRESVAICLFKTLHLCASAHY